MTSQRYGEYGTQTQFLQNHVPDVIRYSTTPISGYLYSTSWQNFFCCSQPNANPMCKAVQCAPILSVYGRLVIGRLVSGWLIKDGWSTGDWLSGWFINGRLVKHLSNEEINVTHCETYYISPPSQISLDPPNIFINGWRCIMFMWPSLRKK